MPDFHAHILVPAGPRIYSRWLPEPDGAQDVAALFRLDRKALAHRTRLLAPGEEDRGRVGDECVLQSHSRGPVAFVRGGVTDLVESFVDRRVAEASPISWRVRMPHQVRTHERGAADHLQDRRIEFVTR